MYKKLYIFWIKFVLSNIISDPAKINLFVKKYDKLIKTTMNDMIILEIIPIKFTRIRWEKSDQILKLNCKYCFQYLNELNQNKIYIIKYIYNIKSEINIIIVCKSCIKKLKLLNENKTNPIDYSLNSNQQESSAKQKKLDKDEIINKSFINDLLSINIFNSFTNMKCKQKFSFDRNYCTITLYTILEIKLILKTFEIYKNILDFNFIQINNIEKLKYFLLHRFGINQGYFYLEYELAINENLYSNLKIPEFIERKNFLKMIQDIIDNGKLVDLLKNSDIKKQSWSKDIYLNLIILYEIFKINDLDLNQLGIKSKYLNVSKYMHIFEKFNKNIKNEIQKKFLNNYEQNNNYGFNMQQLCEDIQNFNKSSNIINYLYNRNEFENTIINYFKSYKIHKKQIEIMSIENGIKNLEFYNQ